MWCVDQVAIAPARVTCAKAQTNKLTVKAGQKYSGTCSLIRTAGAMIQVSNFKIKTGKGSFQLRGLQLGQTRLNLSCKQPSGSGPYAFQIHTLVIVN